MIPEFELDIIYKTNQIHKNANTFSNLIVIL